MKKKILSILGIVLAIPFIIACTRMIEITGTHTPVTRLYILDGIEVGLKLDLVLSGIVVLTISVNYLMSTTYGTK